MADKIIVNQDKTDTPVIAFDKINDRMVTFVYYKTGSQKFMIENIDVVRNGHHKSFATLYNEAHDKLLGPIQIFPTTEYLDHENLRFDIKGMCTV